MEMKAEILQALKAADGFLSGQELCERLNVSRTAVWKVIQQLEEDGYEIEAVRNRGYRLRKEEAVYNRAEIWGTLSTEWLGRPFFFHDTLDSTNNEVRRLAEQNAAEGTLVVAREQSAGKGRRGRSWVSPEGDGVWMSFLLRPEFPPECASMITLIAAMAVADGIREITGLETGIKWPNDIVAEGKKICGILTEMSSDMDSIHYVIVGIGINVGITEFPEELRLTASSLELLTGQKVNQARLINAVLKGWEKYYPVFLERLDLSGLQSEYNRMLVNQDREVRVLAPKGDYEGISRGITETGELLVELPDGELRRVMSGEVSVRGIYGYV